MLKEEKNIQITTNYKLSVEVNKREDNFDATKQASLEGGRRPSAQTDHVILIIIVVVVASTSSICSSTRTHARTHAHTHKRAGYYRVGEQGSK